MFIHGDTIFHTLYGNMVVLKLLSRKLLKQLFIVPVQAKKILKCHIREMNIGFVWHNGKQHGFKNN